MPITALPSLDRTSVTFKTDLDSYFLSALPAFSSEANALQTDVNAKQVTASAAAVTAAAQAVLAADQVALATTQALAAASSAAVAGAVAWVSGLTYAVGDARYSPINLQTYRRKVSGAGTTDPSADLTNWGLAVDAGASLLRSARTSNTVLGNADKGKLIDITSGTFTQTFAAVATLADGWYCYLKNSGTGDVTLDPNASELIDGMTSYVMYPGEVRLVQCDGLALRSVVLNAFYRTFTASGTFTTPPGYSQFSGLLWSGGGGGGCTQGGGLGGGRGGGCFPFSLTSSAFGASKVITIGAGGSGASTQVQSTGGNSSIGSLVTVYGATATLGGSVIPQGTNYNDASNVGATGFDGAGQGNTVMKASSVWGGSSAGFNVDAGNSIYGGASGGGINGSSTIYQAGISIYGGSGGSAVMSGTAGNGQIPAGGGGSSNTSGGAGGSGARGECRIWGII